MGMVYSAEKHVLFKFWENASSYMRFIISRYQNMIRWT
jgi:hypothetical protein